MSFSDQQLCWITSVSWRKLSKRKISNILLLIRMILSFLSINSKWKIKESMMLSMKFIIWAFSSWLSPTVLLLINMINLLKWESTTGIDSLISTSLLWKNLSTVRNCKIFSRHKKLLILQESHSIKITLPSLVTDYAQIFTWATIWDGKATW